MPSDLRELPCGYKLIGEYGVYFTKEILGSGGNGVVYEVIDNRDSEHVLGTYAVKVFCPPLSLDANEKSERFHRFKNEIVVTKRIEKQVFGLVPILDYHIASDTMSDLTWYLMPKARRYHFSDSWEKNIDELIALGEIVHGLHRIGVEHRDIKPGNLLYYNKHLVLSDLGLCWDESFDFHITGSSEVLGPFIIRPPELEEHRNPESIDYKKSDVYLFAKTVWMVLSKKWNGFKGEYNRKDSKIYLEKKDVGVKTLEPIHKMLEGATKNNFKDRISIEECLSFLQIQKRIIDGTLDSRTLKHYLYEETLGFANTLDPDIRQYNSPELVSQVLKRLSDFSFSVYLRDSGKSISIGEYSFAEEINNQNDYSIRLYDNKRMELKTLILHIVSLDLNKKNSIIKTGQCNQMSENAKECFSVKDVLEPGYSTYIISGEFSLVFDSDLSYV